MDKSNNKDMTVYELAQIVGDSFTHVEGRFARMDQRFDKMDQRFDKMDQRFDKMDVEIKLVRSDLERKIDNFRSEIMGQLYKLEERIEAVEIKLDRIDKNVNDDILMLGDEIYHIKLRTKKLEQKFAKLKLANS